MAAIQRLANGIVAGETLLDRRAGSRLWLAIKGAKRSATC